jgi:hypothetical protein
LYFYVYPAHRSIDGQDAPAKPEKDIDKRVLYLGRYDDYNAERELQQTMLVLCNQVLRVNTPARARLGTPSARLAPRLEASTARTMLSAEQDRRKFRRWRGSSELEPLGELVRRACRHFLFELRNLWHLVGRGQGQSLKQQGAMRNRDGAYVPVGAYSLPGTISRTHRPCVRTSRHQRRSQHSQRSQRYRWRETGKRPEGVLECMMKEDLERALRPLAASAK